MQVARELSIERLSGAPWAGRGPEALRAPRLPERAAPHVRGARRARPVPGVAVWAAAALVWCAAVGTGVWYVRYQAESQRLSARLSGLRAEADRLEQENRNLRAVVSELSSMERIEREARRLGLVKPQELRVVAVNPGVLRARSAAVARAPDPVPAPGGLWSRIKAIVGSIRVARAPGAAVSGQ